MGIDSLLPEQTSIDAIPAPTKLEGAVTMDEFMQTFESQHAASKAANPASASEKPLQPAPKLGAGPVAIGARTSKYTIALHDKCQKLGIPQPVFTFEGSSDRGWAGQVNFPGLHEELQGIKYEDGKFYPSKKESKEVLSERAFKILERLEKDGTVKKSEVHSARVSRYTVALHEKVQKLGIPLPFFEYTGSTEKGWSAQASFPGFDSLPTLSDENYHTNKQEAKEAMCKQVFQAVEAAEREGHFAKANGLAQPTPGEKEVPGPNYVGQLLEFQRATRSPEPVYEDYANGTQFTCIATIEGEGTFGSLDARYTSKKIARREAARAAVEFFKSAGRWPENFSDLGGIKKKKVLQANSPQPISAPAPEIRQPSIALTPLGTGSFPEQVGRLAHILSLRTPEWRFTPSAVERDFYTVQCFFTGGGEHAGPIGEVRNVLGKKKAKEECARLTLEYLNEVYERRVADTQRLMEGIDGGGNASQSAVSGHKEEQEEKAEAVQAEEQFVKEMGGYSSDELEIEDVMEDVRA